MKFKSPVYTQASGSIGGLTYAHTRGVMYTRGRGLVTNPNTGSQQLARSALSTLSAQWATIIPAEQDAWANYAAGTPLINALGDPLILTGQQMFVRCNAPRLRFGAPIITVGPVTLGVPTFTPVTLVANSGSFGTIDVDFDNGDAWATAVGGFMFVQSGPAISPGRRYFKGPFYGVGSIAGLVIPPASPVNFNMVNNENIPPTSYNSATDQLVFARVVVSEVDGRLSYEQIVSAVVV